MMIMVRAEQAGFENCEVPMGKFLKRFLHGIRAMAVFQVPMSMVMARLSSLCTIEARAWAKDPNAMMPIPWILSGIGMRYGVPVTSRYSSM